MESIEKLAELALPQVKGVQAHVSRQFAEIVNRSATACLPELREDSDQDLLPEPLLQQIHLQLAQRYPWITPAFARAARDILAETSSVPDNDIVELATRYLASSISVLATNYEMLYELAREHQDNGRLLGEILVFLHPFALAHFEEYLAWKYSSEGADAVPSELLDSVWLARLEEYFPEATRGSLRQAPKQLFFERYRDQIKLLGPITSLDAAFLTLGLVPQ